MPRRFVRYVWFVLAYNLFVILWGAVVRATGSGAGCGSHWPLCNGEVVPQAPQVETMIEFTHRLTSGLAGILVIGMVVWAVRIFPRGHMARRGAWLSLIFIIIEGLLGAGLVLLELVGDNASVARATAMGIHLVNTLILIGFIGLTGWWGAGGQPLRLRNQGWTGWLLLGGVLGMMVIGATGAIAALGNTLFPSSSLQAGLVQDFDPTAHFLIRLRIWHPIISILLGVYLIAAANLISRWRPSSATRTAAAALLLLFFLQLGVGTINLVLKAPIALSLIHLMLADIVWLALVFLGAAALAVDAPGTLESRQTAAFSD
jgi:heme A synthase